MTSQSYRDLLAQREALDQVIANARREERAVAIEIIKNLISEFGISASELSTRQGPKKGGAGAPKYRDIQSGKTWTGRGKPPAWIAGKERDSFLISNQV